MKSTTSLFIIAILLLLTSVIHPAAQKPGQSRTSACTSIASTLGTPVRYFYNPHVLNTTSIASGFYGQYAQITHLCTCTDGKHNPSLLRTFADTVFCRQLVLKEQVPAT